MRFQQRVDNPALHADTPSVYDPDLTVSSQQRLMQVFFDKIGDLVWLEGMKIDRILDRQFNRFRHVRSMAYCRYCRLLDFGYSPLSF